MFKRVLVLAPHTDDGEFGCGATLSRLSDEGSEVYYIAFSAPLIELEDEVVKAIGVLGLTDVRINQYPVRKFHTVRQEILDYMIALKLELKPDLVLVPSPHDQHQDHMVISQEAFRAFRTVSLLAYDLPWNYLTFDTKLFIKVTKADMDKKMKALECYGTQAGRHYLNKAFIYGLASVRGVQVQCEYAECFEVIRWVI